MIPDVTQHSLELSSVIMPSLALLVAVTLARFFYDLTRHLTARYTFRAKGYQVHQSLMLNGREAVITRIGVWNTHFEVYSDESEDYKEFQAISNLHLDQQDVRILVQRITKKPPPPPRKRVAKKPTSGHN